MARGAFQGLLRSLGKNLIVNEFPTGGHFEFMPREGIPAAIIWLNKLAKNAQTKSWVEVAQPEQSNGTRQPVSRQNPQPQPQPQPTQRQPSRAPANRLGLPGL